MPMGMTYLYYALSGVVCRHISVGFLLFLFDLIGIARPPFVNKTTEVCAFFVSVCVEYGINNNYNPIDNEREM